MIRKKPPTVTPMGYPDPPAASLVDGELLRASPFSEDQEAIINPARDPGEEPVTPAVVMTFTQPDFKALCRLAQAQDSPRHFWGCACRAGFWEGVPLTVTAPALGSPYAAMVLEKLIVLGAKRILVLGWCGSLSPHVRIGDLIVPSSAIPGDGTSPHYCLNPGEITPHADLYDLLRATLRNADVPWHTGPVWSTDAFFRETRTLVKSCQDQGVLGIDLELAALLAVGRFRQVAVVGLLVVSDELFSLNWQPAQGSQPFRAGRNAALRLALEVAAASLEA